MATGEPLTIYTIGHSNRTADEFVGALADGGISSVVDVRSTPYSQYNPQFNRETLESRLLAAGLRYAFAGQTLGGRPTDPTCYRDGVVPAGGADFLSLVDYEAVAQRPWYQAGIERLIAIARETPTAVMCSEEDPERCHRHHLIAQSLIERGITVTHLRRDGSLEPAAPRVKQLSLLG